MKDLWAILKYEAWQLLTKKIVTVLVLILAAGLAFVLLHTHEYKNLEDQKTIFQDVEKNKIEMYSSYRQYASFGFRVLFIPAPVSILFANSAVIQDMTAYIDSGERLNIYKPMKSKNVFNITKYMFADCSGIFFFFASLIAVFYGFPVFRESEYLKMLSSIAGKKNLFCKVLLARAMLLALYSLLFLASAVLVIALCGVSIGIDQYLAVFFLEMCGLTAFFLFLGAAFGSSKSMLWGLGNIITAWLSLLFFLPFLISLIVSINAASIKPETQLEIEKLKLMMSFEKDAKEKNVTLDLNQNAGDIQRQYIQSYYKNQFQAMQKLEDQLKAQMHACIKLHYRLSSFFPTTFYQSLTNELSSKGYETLESFYNTVKQIKEAFFKEYIQKVYFSPQPTQPTEVEPFLKGDENIFVGKSALPGYLILGFCFNLIWIVVLTLFTYYRFQKSLAELPEKKKDEIEPKDVKVAEANIVSWRTYKTSFSNIVYNLLSNQIRELVQKGYRFQMTISGQLLNTAKKGMQFLYLCPPWEIPGHFVTGHFVELLMDLMKVDKTKRKEIKARFSLDSFKKKKISQLATSELGQVYLAILEMKSFPIYLINDVPNGMLLEFCTALKQKMFELYQDGSTIFFLSSEANYYYPRRNQVKIAEETLAWFKKINAMLDEKEEEEMDREETGKDKIEDLLK